MQKIKSYFQLRPAPLFFIIISVHNFPLVYSYSFTVNLFQHYVMAFWLWRCQFFGRKGLICVLNRLLIVNLKSLFWNVSYSNLEHIFKGISFIALWIWEFLKTASQNWENPHNQKIKHTLKYSKGHKIWTKRGIEMKFSGLLLMMMMMNCFCGMVDQRKAFSLISSQDHCQRSSPSRISDMPQAGFESAQNQSSGFVEWIQVYFEDMNSGPPMNMVELTHCYLWFCLSSDQLRATV